MAYDDHDHVDDETERQRLLQSVPMVHLNENILPLPGGRRAHTLVEFSQTDSDEKQHLIERTRTSFEKELQELDNLDDPLEVYVRYIQWITDTFPTGDNKESQLFVVLQKTCHQLQDDTRYMEDLRYLKCWLQLAKFMKDPKDIFELLRQKGIGQSWALFYEEYSRLYEERKKYKEARLVLEKGVEQRAQPLSRLEQTLQHFIARIERVQQIQSQSTPSTNSSQHQERSRTILGVKVDPKLRKSMSQTGYNNLQNSSSSSSSGINGLSSGLPRRPLGNTLSPATSLQHRSRKFIVPSDDMEDQTISPSQALADRIFPPVPTSPNKITKVSLDRLSRHPTENMPNVEKPGDSTLPLDSRYVRPAKFQIDICRDTDDDNVPARDSSKQHSHRTDLGNVSTQNNKTTQPPSSNASIDRHPQRIPPFDMNDPHHKRLSSSSSSSSSSSRLTNDGVDILESRYHKMQSAYIKTQDSAGNPETIAALTECLGGPGPMKPISFEELRVTRQVDRTGKPQVINGKAPQRITLPEEDESIPCRMGRGRSPTMEYTAETLAAMQDIGAIFSQRQNRLEPDDQDNDDNQQPKRRKQTFVNENN